MNLIDAWDASYGRGENHLFWPAEELVRFAARHVRRRTVEGWQDRISFDPPPRALDLGCGLGRHVAFLDELGCEAWGIDHSATAVEQGRGWLARRGSQHLSERLVVGDAGAMPWPDGHFRVVVSHGVLDSMPSSVAAAAISECHRLLSAEGLAYIDLVSGDDGQHGREFAGELTVPSGHEAGTIQRYFNWSAIERLLAGRFQIIDATHVLRADALRPGAAARWHLVLRRSPRE
jgi:SAM-dependent methyltransferase